MPAEKTVDVIIPVYHPKEEFTSLIKMLEKQDFPVHQLILMQTRKSDEEKLSLETTMDTRVISLLSEEFDHGKTRMDGIKASTADYVLLMTQDAVPENEKLISEMLKGFQTEKVISVYARQLPCIDCREIEKFTRAFNYPDESRVKTEKDIEKYGIKTFFCSDVCAMYDRNALISLGGFTLRTIFNEDMIYAHKVITNGYGIYYAADARVIHSHNYSGREQFHRNFDLAVSQKDHPEVFESVSSEKEGMSLVKKTIRHLFKIGKWYLVFQLIFMSGMKYLGYFFGKRYQKLPKKMVLKFTMNKNYWRNENGTD